MLPPKRPRTRRDSRARRPPRRPCWRLPWDRLLLLLLLRKLLVLLLLLLLVMLLATMLMLNLMRLRGPRRVPLVVIRVLRPCGGCLC